MNYNSKQFLFDLFVEFLRNILWSEVYEQLQVIAQNILNTWT